MFFLLKKRGFLFLTLSNAMSQFGDRLTHMVIISLIHILSPGRVTAFSEFSMTFTIPVIILSPFAGVLVDHWNKKNIMIRAHYIQAFFIFITPFFIMLTKSMIPVWITVVIFFSLDIFNNTAKLAVIPSLVEKDSLVPANSILLLFARVATFGGMVLGGFLIKWLGWRLGFFLDAATHFIAGSFVIWMGKTKLFEPQKRIEFGIGERLKKALRQFIQDLKDVFILLLRDKKILFVIISLVMVPFTTAIAYTALIYIVQQVLGLGTPGVGITGGIIGIGMILGAFLTGTIGKKADKFLWIIFSVFVYSLFFLFGRYFITVLFIYSLSLISGILFSFIGIFQDTILQEEVDEGTRGRIFGVKEFVVNTTFLPTAIGAGILSDLFSYEFVITLTGFFLLAMAGGLFYIRIRFIK